MAPSRDFPYRDGDITVLGPEIFANADQSVICWRGQNYTRQPEPGERVVTIRSGPLAKEVQSAIMSMLRKARRQPPSGGRA